MHTKPAPSLKARAIMWLAQREHSRGELRDKLLTHIRNGPSGVADSTNPGAVPSDVEGAVDQLLDWLESHHYLSQARFLEARVNARAPRFGNLRIRHELALHGVHLPPQQAQALQQSEVARARVVWQRKFKTVATDAAERAKQMRFLAGRGFSADVIRRVVKGAGDDD
jgi:regulatory protein